MAPAIRVKSEHLTRLAYLLLLDSILAEQRGGSWRDAKLLELSAITDGDVQRVINQKSPRADARA
jgi:hypothetical protein